VWLVSLSCIFSKAGDAAKLLGAAAVVAAVWFMKGVPGIRGLISTCVCMVVSWIEGFMDFDSLASFVSVYCSDILLMAWCSALVSVGV